MRICVFAASSNKPDQAYFDCAYELGCTLAKRGHGIVFGGGKQGLMGALARGVYKHGGEIIGVAPKFFNEPNVLFEHCNELIYPDTMRERKQIMDDLSHAWIVLPGGIGTFEEFFEVLTLKQLGRTNEPIVLLNVNNYFEPLMNLIDKSIEDKFVAPACRTLVEVCKTPEDALLYIENYTPSHEGSIFRLDDH